MARAGTPLAATQPAGAAGPRQMWDEGHEGPALRAALDDWDRVLQSADLAWLARGLRACGLGGEALAVQLASTRKQAQVRSWEGLIRSILQSGDPWWARDLLAEVDGDSRELEALRIEVALALGDPAPLIAAWVGAHRDEAALDAAVRWYIRSDRIDEAARLVDESEGLTLWRARFALWRNRPDVARPLLATLPADPEVRCLDAIALVLEGDLAEAETRLRALLDTDARGEAWTWLATVLRKQQRYAEAMRAAETASAATVGFSLVARVEREIASDYQWMSSNPPLPEAAPPGLLQRLLGTAKRLGGQFMLRRIEELENAEALYPLGVSSRDSIATLEAALERFAGNHTVHLSTTVDGKLTSYPIPVNPRQLGATVQLVLWTRGADATRALYDELAPRVDDHPLYRIYHGELELWMGAYADAERIFRRILDRDNGIRWAWIGLGASVMLQGDLDQAQTIWDRGLSHTRGEPGPTLFAYRGECYRRQGARERAREQLETGLRQKPHRLSSRINLALLDRDPEMLARAERDCVAFAPLLMAELTGDPAERLEQVLLAMRGNRSSSEWNMSYHLWGRLWRRGVTDDARKAS